MISDSATLAARTSPWTGRLLPANSTLAAARLACAAPPPESRAVAAAAVQSARASALPDMARILRPQAVNRWIMPQLAAVTPTYIESVLRGAFTGSHIQQWELFDLMEDTWPRLLKNLAEIKRAALALDWQLHPWAEEDQPPTASAEERHRLVSSALWGMQPDAAADENDLMGTGRDLADAWGKGTSVCEVLWHQRDAGKLGSIIAPRATVWAHPSAYGWSAEGRLGLNVAQTDRAGSGRFSNAAYLPQSGDIEDFPPDKFLIGLCKAKTGSPLTSALLRPLAWWWCAANFSADWLMNLAQIFGLPFRWANYASGSSQETINTISAALEGMGSAAWASFPEGVTLELKEASGNAGDSPQADLIDRADKNCDLLVLGQTLTSTQGDRGSQALGTIHADVRDDVIASVAGFIAGIYNRQLIPSILRLNYGDEEEAPELRPCVHETEDQKSNADRDKVLLDAGVALPKEWLYKRHDIPLPRAGEETIGGKAEPAETPPMNGQPAAEKSAPPDKLEARAAAPPHARAFAATALHEFSKAVAHDLDPIRAQLEAILKIEDDTIFETRLRAWLARVEKLKADVLADPAAAHKLNDIIATSLVNGLSQRP